MPASGNARDLKWIISGALVGFGSSFIFGDFLNLPVDFYYLLYFAAVVSFFSAYIRKTNLDLKKWISGRLGWAILLGIVFGILMAKNVFSRPETEKFAGAYLVWLIFWRGLIYGLIDGLLLSSFPFIVTWRAFDV